MIGQRGAGLVETMVALALGLLVTLAASAMLLLANRDFVHHGANVRLDDGGRYALELTGQALRQAAWVDPDGARPAADAEAAIGGLDNASLPRMAAGTSATVAAVQRSDVLAIRFGGPATAEGNGSVLDCAGFAVDPGQAGWSIFYVGVADDGETELRCKYRGGSGNWNADAIVRGVDAFQVQYGIDTDEPRDGLPNRYLSAGAIHALDAALVQASSFSGLNADDQARELRRSTHWKRVAAVRLALLLHGEAGSRLDRQPARYQLFDTDPDALVDEAALPEAQRWRVRRVFEQTVFLRNRDG
jgi:type IV pilus assembly protein PilW